jgi:hypothetical protein
MAGHIDPVKKVGAYDLPKGLLALDGPIARPAPGTLPIRGDLAHIALARRYLVAHYVVPQVYRIGPEDTELKLTANPESETVTMLPAGSAFEILDHAGAWSWGCVGPEGPTGYVLSAQLAEWDQ